MTAGESVRRGFATLTVFSGRDARSVFWPYAGVVLTSGLILGNVVMAPLVVADALRPTPDPAALMLPMLASTGLTALLTAGALAAAVTRRLHDRGHRGVWAVVPLVLVLSALAVMVPFNQRLEAGGDGVWLLFVTGAGLVVTYFATLACLVVQLVLPSRPEGNRFGPAMT